MEIPSEGSIDRNLANDYRDIPFLRNEFIENATSIGSINSVIPKGGNTKLRSELVTYASGRGRRIFLLLMHIENMGALPSLCQANFTDDDLPVKQSRYVEKPPHYKILSLETSPGAAEKEFSVFFDCRYWKKHQLKLFCISQWEVLAPVFDEKRLYYPLTSKHPVPLLSVTSTDSQSGQSCTVSQHQLEWSHLKGSVQDQHLLIALKEIKPKNSKYFEQEAEVAKKGFKHSHFNAPIAIYTFQDDNQKIREYCFIFPWANGGNLKDFWQSPDIIAKRTDHSFLKWSLTQMYKLADAIHGIHKMNCRHGDIKPENILHFDNGKRSSILKISDLGVAKFHAQDTESRRGLPTNTMTISRPYAAPTDPEINGNTPRSRRFDVWSLGCVYLEYLIWLLRGSQEWADFSQHHVTTPFWDSSGDKIFIRADVQTAMEMKPEYGNEAIDKAFTSLLKLIKTRLLVVKLDDEDGGTGEKRADSSELINSIKHIHDEITGQYEGAGLDLNDPDNQPLELSLAQYSANCGTDNVAVSSKPHESENTNSPGDVAVSDPKIRRLNDDWEAQSDDNFGRMILNSVHQHLPLLPLSNRLCEHCKNMDIWSADFGIHRKLFEVQTTATTCDLCILLYNTIKKTGIGHHEGLSLVRVGSSLVDYLTRRRILSIYADLHSNHNTANIPQLGLPILSQQGGEVQRILLQQWMSNCDATHNCMTRGGHADQQLPTRVIDVGDHENTPIRLLDGTKDKHAKYIALSHIWGQLEDDDKFCASEGNMEQLKQCINFADLPQTFQDAIYVTRLLRIRYLWIDSICIIQDKEEDWEKESAKMEQVYASAYCTLATSSARSSIDGFLKPRMPVDCIRLDLTGAAGIYIREFVDNFKEDVENSPLAGRGWVLQERALSRRTIFFTSNQVYWECGQGIYCETLAKLSNKRSMLLGDSAFPNVALQYYQDDRIYYIQHLYKKYSRLGLSNPTDRPAAIRGLENRLAEVLHTKSNFGVFESFKSQGLLWKRSKGSLLRPINFNRKTHVQIPSWSWMAYEGPIDYWEIPSGGVDWTDDFQFKFVSQNSGYSRQAKPTIISAKARKLKLADINMITKLVLDQNFFEQSADTLFFVILGKEKNKRDTGRMLHWGLVIEPTLDGLYKRIGSGAMLESDFADNIMENVQLS